MLHGFNILRQQYSNLAKPGGGNQSAVSTIQTLADRLAKADENSINIEDRRAAVLALKGLSRDHNRAVGEHALPALLTSLQRDAKDEDTARALIECCITLCEVQPADSAASNPHHNQQTPKRKLHEQGPPPGLLHTDVFLEQPGPLHCLLPLLAPDRAFYTRFASLQLLGSLLRNRPHRVQDHVLVAPGGCGAILECLAEGAGSSAEIVRNEALLLLPHLVHGNADIQKLVAFEGAFEKLLDVCAAEGRVEGGVIVQDALEGLEALLRYNVSNQNYFRETLSIPMLAPLLFYPPGPANNEFASKHAEQEYARQLEAFCFQDWDQQKVTNAKIVLDIAALLIGGQGDGRRANQGALLQCGMTKCLLDLALASTAPASLKAQALHVAASLMQASRPNQDLLSTLLVQPITIVSAPTPDALERQSGELEHAAQPPTPEVSFSRSEPKPAVVCLVDTAIGTSGAKGALGFRAAAMACFRAYVADNMDARLAIINGMAPDADDKHDGAAASAAPAGKVLLEAILQNPSTHASSANADAYKHLVAAMLFSYLLRSSETAKKAARAIAVNPDGSIVRNARADQDEAADDDDDDDDDTPSSLIQVVVGNLTLSERELADAVRKERASAMGATVSSASYSAADWTRIMIGYLVLLSVWLFESPLSVRDFLSESATLQAVIQPVAQSSGVDPLIQGLAAFLLGVAYEFDADPGKAAVTRETMHPILHSRIGADQFAVRIGRVADDVRFREVTPDVLEKLIVIEEQAEADELRAKQQAEARAAAEAAAAAAAAAKASDPSAVSPEPAKPEDKEKADEEAQDKDLEVNGLGHLSKRRRAGLWFDWSFVEFWRANSTLISKTITVDPASSSAAQAAVPAELLDAQRQAEALRDTVAKQAREIELLEKRIEELSAQHAKEIEALRSQLETAETTVSSHAPQLQAAQTELEQLKSAHAAALADIQTRHDALAAQLGETQAREESSNGKVLQLTSEMARISAGKPSQKEFAALQKAHDELKKKQDAEASGSGNTAMKDLLEARELATKRAEEIAALQEKLAALEASAADRVPAQAQGEGELQKKLDQALREKAELESKAAELQASNAATSKGEELQAKLDQALREKTELEGKAAELEAATAQIAELKTQAEAKVALEKKISDLEASHTAEEGQAKQLEELSQKHAALETQFAALDKVAQGKAELEKKLKTLEAADAKAKDLEKKLADLGKVEKEKAELEKKVQTLGAVEKQKKDLEAKVKQLEKSTKDNKQLEAKAKQLDQLTKEKKELEAKLKTFDQLTKEKKELESKAAQVDKLTKEKTELEAKLKSLESASKSEGGAELETLRTEKDEIAKENEDLLVLLEELTQKRKKDKAKLKEKGEEVSEDEDEDDDDDE